MGQPVADGLKFLLKEDYRPARTDKVLFTLGPQWLGAGATALIGFVIIPWGGMWELSAGAIGGSGRSRCSVGLPSSWGCLAVCGRSGGGVVHVAGANVNVRVIYLLAVASVGVYGVTIGGWASNNKFSFTGRASTAQMISYEIPMGIALLATLLIVTFVPQGNHRAPGLRCRAS
ncbi:MAG: complex I subunit 1 family protein [Phycisphaerales bacterium]